LVREDLSPIWENRNYDFIFVPREEASAANCIAISEEVLMPAGFPKTSAEVRKRGFHVHEIEITEFEKGDGSLTCLAVFFAVQNTKSRS
jgi:dimethylargininase